jgi:hypothetical protein
MMQRDSAAMLALGALGTEAAKPTASNMEEAS